MKPIVTALSVALILPLAACGSPSSSEKLAERVEEAADNRASALESNAESLRNEAAALDNRAEQVRDTAEERADAIEAADRNVAAMSQEKRDAVVLNEAPAVR